MGPSSRLRSVATARKKLEAGSIATERGARFALKKVLE